MHFFVILRAYLEGLFASSRDKMGFISFILGFLGQEFLAMIL